MLRRTLLQGLLALPGFAVLAQSLRPVPAPVKSWQWTEADIADVARRWDAKPQRTPEEKAALCQRLYGFGGWYAGYDVVPPELKSP